MLGLIVAAVVVAFILLLIFLPIAAYSILAFIALVLIVLLFIPIGAEFSYIGGELSLSAKLGPYYHKLLPKTPKDDGGKESGKKEKSEKKEKAQSAKKPKKKLELNFEEIVELLKKALKGVSKFGKLSVHKFMLHYIAAGKDPYSTAMTYNYVNAGLSSLAPCCSKAFNVSGDIDVWTDIDFTRDKMLVDTEFIITLRLIQLLHVALVAGFGILGVLIKNKRRISRERKAAQKTDNHDSKNTDTNIQTEERMDSNG